MGNLPKKQLGKLLRREWDAMVDRDVFHVCNRDVQRIEHGLQHAGAVVLGGATRLRGGDECWAVGRVHLQRELRADGDKAEDGDRPRL